MEKRYNFTQMKSRSKERGFRTQEQLEEYILTSLKMSLYSYFTELYNSKEELPQGLKRALLMFLLYFSTNGQFTYDRQGEFRPVYADAMTVSLLVPLSAVVATCLSIAYNMEEFNLNLLIGGVVIMVSIAVSAIFDYRRECKNKQIEETKEEAAAQDESNQSQL